MENKLTVLNGRKKRLESIRDFCWGGHRSIIKKIGPGKRGYIVPKWMEAKGASKVGLL